MLKIKLSDIDLGSLGVVLNKAGRVVDGINHGRMVLKGDGVYYKIFDKEYCRRENFVKALEAGFFDEVAPALQSLIVDGDDIVGYVTKAGEQLGSEFDRVPEPFYQKMLACVDVTNMFFYDLVASNIITIDGRISLIDLESVYDLDELYTIDKHNAKVKPDYYLTELERLWRKNMKPISFIQPSRNNLKYLQWSYNSIRKNLGYRHEICWADDFSDDGTWEWMQEIAEKDKNVKIHRNEGPTRLGHTILYDTLINDCATNDIVMIYHADMYACPNMDVEVLKHLERGKVVSATRIEPPLHPDGPEKVLKDFGIEPEEFDEKGLLEFLEEDKYGEEKLTEGIFAPWVIYKDDFQSIGGHDPLYAPQSKEDSDIFNRFQLAGYETIQTWQGYVYHMTCRGSRFKDGAMRNPAGQVFMKGRESSEWLAQNLRSTRNFIRKWGHMVKHDEHLKPIVPPKYDIGFVAYNCDKNLLRELEPWCSKIYLDFGSDYLSDYIKEEQPDTQFDLEERIKLYGKSKISELHDICVEFDCRNLNANNFQVIVNLSEIIKESGEVGIMEHEIFKFYISSLNTYEKDLIICKS
nr:putative glycosyltransferase [uncultured Mediterranean phage uvMED]